MHDNKNKIDIPSLDNRLVILHFFQLQKSFLSTIKALGGGGSSENFRFSSSEGKEQEIRKLPNIVLMSVKIVR